MPCTNSNGGSEVLNEQDTLGLNDEEINEFVDVANNGVKGLLGDSIVLPGTELGRETIVQDSLSGNLGGNGDGERQPRKLEAIPQKI